jgi:UDP-N-acetylmuramoyl-tripeptide--D-alanyl-D-alanine ligase
MINITVKDIVEATGGKLLNGDENVVLADICINSKEVKPGDLFVPIIGAKVDAHKFIEQALTVAAATLTSEPEEYGTDFDGKPCIAVDDTVKALQGIGRYIRKNFNMPVVAVTGSVGKTTTREMVTAAVATGMRCFHTEKNYNSIIGAPITVSRMTHDYDAAVLELGIGMPGEMDILTEIAKPDICVVTTIGVAHIEYMGSLENTRKEKLSIIHGMSEGGTLYINGDDPMLYEIKDSMPCKVITYGCGEDMDFRATNIRMEDGYSLYDMVYKDQVVPVKVGVMGKHNICNSLAAIAVAYQLGVPFEKSSKVFENFAGQRQRVIKVPDKYTVIDDTYNASPDSMKASVDVLCDMKCEGKKYIVLGDMLELGENSDQYHAEVGEYLRDKKIDEVIVVGEHSKKIKEVIDAYEGHYARTVSFADTEEIAIYLMALMKPEDVVLLKASNGMHLSEVVNILSN